jgi:hypothetical protein
MYRFFGAFRTGNEGESEQNRNHNQPTTITHP